MFKFRFASISDIHLGDPHTPTEEIIDKLDEAFPDNKETGLLDAIFIGGDLFDRLLWLNDANVNLVQLWIYRLFRLCKKHNIVLRVLEGTPSHDRKQFRSFMAINEIGGIGCDVRHVESLEIEYFPQFNAHVLYVPDEWKNDTDEAWKDVNKALQAKNLTQVDYAIMHGAFRHQLPDVAAAPKHIEERYLSVVKRVIMIGHIHKASRWDRIYSNGSFDRLDHGYETPKGFWIVDSYGDNDIVQFVENKRAKIYRTIDCRGLSLEEAMEKVEQENREDNPFGSRFRIKANKEDPILGALAVIRQKFSGYVWETKIDDERRKNPKQITELTKTKHMAIDINKDNIVELITARLRKRQVDEATIAHAIKRLQAG